MQCNKAFSMSGNLKRHKLSHTGENEFAFTQCDKAFSRPRTLKKHNLSHTGEKLWTAGFTTNDKTSIYFDQLITSPGYS